MIRKGRLERIIALAMISVLCVCASGDEFLLKADLEILDRPAKTMMSDYLTALVDEQFAKRADLLAGLKTAEDWDRHATFIRRSMAAWTGPLPERTPLRARITGRIKRDRYTLEKILFESRPHFIVSANLYLPRDHSGPCPAVLNVIGHSPAGKATEKVQRRAIAQARKGFVALVVDGIGQGERQEQAYAHVHSPPGNVHQVVGTQAFIAGTHVFNFMVWDAIRAVDYLVSRPEVDPTHIACTGCSGGGMMTTYVLAFEPRIAVAVPACNPCTWSHRVAANLGTDHEQVFFGAFAAGIDPRGDPLFCQAPKPLLINATSDDKLNPPIGVWELSSWLYRAYAAHGAPQKLQTTMVNAPHGYNKEQREVAYAWMLQWLGGDAAGFREEDFAVGKESDTWCTTEGSVYREPKSRHPHDLVLEHFETHAPQQEMTKSQLRTSIKEVLGLQDSIREPLVDIGDTRSAGAGAMQLTSVTIAPENGIVLPAVWIELPVKNATGPVIVYLNDKGKSALVDEKTVLQALLDKGYRVFAVDLRGTGETSPGMEGEFWDFLAGRPIFGQRVADLRSVVQYLSRLDNDGKGVHVWAKGVSALYAALVAPLTDGISGLVLEEPLLTFEQIVTTKVPTYQHEIILPGVLAQFDLPQIYRALCPMRIALINPLSGDKSQVSQERAERAYRPVTKIHTGSGKLGNWCVHADCDDRTRSKAILSAFTLATGN